MQFYLDKSPQRDSGDLVVYVFGLMLEGTFLSVSSNSLLLIFMDVALAFLQMGQWSYVCHSLKS